MGLRGCDRLRALASGLDHIILAHDPEAMRRYPAALPGAASVACRLDAVPRQP